MFAATCANTHWCCLPCLLLLFRTCRCCLCSYTAHLQQLPSSRVDANHQCSRAGASSCCKLLMPLAAAQCGNALLARSVLQENRTGKLISVGELVAAKV
jgi:hypothetical protein